MAHPRSHGDTDLSVPRPALTLPNALLLNGLIERVRRRPHRVLFVRKGSDATEPFLWSGLSANRVTAAGQHVKRTPPSSGSGMSLITMAAADT